MINELDRSIINLLSYELEGVITPVVQITFDPPKEGAFPYKPTVNLFLYDVREDLEQRHRGLMLNNANVPQVSQYPILVECTYMVTIWAEDALQEQFIASEVIKALYRHLSIPATLPDKIDPNRVVEILTGSLNNPNLMLPRAVTIQQGYLNNVSEFWIAMGNKPKPLFTYKVTFPMLDIGQ